jgi:hypothetical protein
MRRAAVLAALLAGCGSLPVTSEGVAFLQIEQPTVTTLTVGDSVDLRGRAVGPAGELLDVPIGWRTPDPTLEVRVLDNRTVRVIALAPDSGRVQAVIGADELVSDFLTFRVAEPPPPEENAARPTGPR